MKARQFGDFQTPPALVKRILQLLGPIGEKWERVLEPTCGRGHFIRGIVESASPPKEIIGIEIQAEHIRHARSIRSNRITLIEGDIFQINLAKDLQWKSKGPLIVIGNPPWVTNSEIGAQEGANLPTKSNFKGLRGIAAITGQSNFDIAEFIWLKIISELAAEKPAIAFLCKTSVARNVLEYAQRANLPVAGAEIRKIDSAKWFGAAVEACLFSLQIGSPVSSYQADIFDSLDAVSTESILGFIKGQPVSDISAYKSVAFLEGNSPIEWRQGIKHDAAPIMELRRRASDQWLNGLSERVEVEDDFIFPLIKGSDVKSYCGSSSINKAVIVTQKKVNQDTKYLKTIAPHLWAYLSKHMDTFLKRKSSIYRNKPPFAIFGVGEYSFAPYKVMVSGLHKEPKFIAVGPRGSKPVLCDDTCYMLPCQSPKQATVIAAILNQPLSKKFIASIAFRESKRPLTKAVLKRINILELAKRIKLEDVRDEIMASLREMQGITREDHSELSSLVDALDLGKSASQQYLLNL
jgi:hypothetical protein